MSSLLRPGSRSPYRSAPALCLAAFALLYCLSLSILAHAAEEAIPTAESLTELEQRASQASPREQCFLYTELVDSMTVKAGKELNDGDTDKATATLKQVNRYARLIHLNLARDTKRLKDAQMLMHHTTNRLAQYLHLVSGDDQLAVKDTLKQLDQVNDELLTQIFQH